MADQRSSNILPEYGVSYKPYHEGLANPSGSARHGAAPFAVGNRFSGDDDDDVSDDPVWYSAPRGSLQPALPTAILKKHSASSMTSTETGTSSNPVSPQTSSAEEHDNDADRDDYFPPAPQMQQRRSMQIPVSMRNSRSKQRLSLQKRSPSGSLSSPITSPPGSSAAGRGSVSLDIRESMDMGGMQSAAPGYRESMMRYRPSDLNTNDMKTNLMRRDSLATFTDPVELLSSSRGSVLSSSGGPRPSEDGLSDLLKAARTGNIMMMKASIQDANTDFTQRDPLHGQSALHIAVRFGQFAIVKLLCQKKTRKILLDCVDNRQNTPLHLAAAKSRRITKFLLEQGASVANVNARNQTPLGVHILTSRRDEPLIAEMLLQHKSDPNALLDTSTLIHKAVDMSLYEIAYRLVRYGARLDIKDENDKMVFDKVNRKVLRHLFSKISYPPVWVPNDERKNCMLCSRKFNRFSIGIRRHHCRHCGRLCCGQCSHVSVESVKFPKTFDDRMKKGSAMKNGTKKRVCKTCSIVFKEREEPQEEKNWSDEFVQKVVGCTWEEIEGQQNAPRRSSVV